MKTLSSLFKFWGFENLSGFHLMEIHFVTLQATQVINIKVGCIIIPIHNKNENLEPTFMNKYSNQTVSETRKPWCLSIWIYFIKYLENYASKSDLQNICTCKAITYFCK